MGEWEGGKEMIKQRKKTEGARGEETPQGRRIARRESERERADTVPQMSDWVSQSNEKVTPTTCMTRTPFLD